MMVWRRNLTKVRSQGSFEAPGVLGMAVEATRTAAAAAETAAEGREGRMKTIPADSRKRGFQVC